jgi:hypothetical protein
MKAWPSLLIGWLAINSFADLTPLPYNQPNLAVDLGVGLWAWPMPMDWDEDGDLDLIVSCPDKPYNGCYFFENVGKDQPFKPGVRIDDALRNAQVSYVDGQPRVLVPGSEFTDFLGKKFSTSRAIYPNEPMEVCRLRWGRRVGYFGGRRALG